LGVAVTVTLIAGCAGPIEILTETRIRARRLEAVQELRQDEVDGRVDALASVLGDEDEEVAKAAASALASLGKPGHDRLMKAFKDPKAQCGAAYALAQQVDQDPTIIEMLDPTTHRGYKGSSCLTKQFARFGVKTHAIILDAVISREDWRARRGVFLACRVQPPVLETLEQRLTAKVEPEVARDAVAALRKLLDARPRHCKVDVDGLWAKLFRNEDHRNRALAVLSDHPRREDLLRSVLDQEETCAGPDALVLLVEEEAEPSERDLARFAKQVAASDGECPLVDGDPLIDYLLIKGYARGTDDQRELLESLGWESDAAGSAAHQDVLAGDYQAAAEKPAGARELLDLLVRKGLEPENRTNALLGLTHAGRKAVPEIEQAYPALEDAALRFDLLKIVRDIDGKRSLTLVDLVMQELDRGPDAAQSKTLTKMLRDAGTIAVEPLGREALAAREPGLRAKLFALQVDLGGQDSDEVLATADRLVKRGRSDPATLAAAELLVEAKPDELRDRIVAAVKDGDLSEQDVGLLRILLEKDSATYSALAKPIKKAKDPEQLADLAGKLSEAGAPALAFSCADKAGGIYKKAAKKAKKKKDADAREAATEGAEKMAALRVKLAGEMAAQVADSEAGTAVRVRTLKVLTKAAKTAGAAKDDVLEALDKAADGAEEKALKKGLKKARKKWKKAK